MFSEDDAFLPKRQSKKSMIVILDVQREKTGNRLCYLA